MVKSIDDERLSPAELDRLAMMDLLPPWRQPQPTPFNEVGFYVIDSAFNVLTRVDTEREAMLFATQQNFATSVVDVYGTELDALVIAEVGGR